MTKLQSHQSSCSCGSGKLYQDCCGTINECQVIHFPWVKKNNYHTYLELAISDLLGYAKKYFYNWQESALAKFVSFSQTQDIDKNLSFLFWHWFVINYRFHKDVSPLIDFYLAENEDKIDEKYRLVFNALQDSYLSIYEILWIKNNTVFIRDIFCHKEYVIERNFGSFNNIEAGTLLLTRLVVVGHTAMSIGKPIIVYPDQKGYLLEEVGSVRVLEDLEYPLFLREYAEIICGLVLDLSHGVKKIRTKSRSLVLAHFDRKFLMGKMLSQKGFTLLDRNDKWIKLTWPNTNRLFARIYLSSEVLITVAEENSDLNYACEKINQIIAQNQPGVVPRWIEGYCFSCEEEAEEILVEIMHDKYLEEWLTSPHIALENMTPLQANRDIRGRALLEDLLNDLETLELRAKSRSEYHFPTSVIRTKLKLDKNKISKELMHPEAIAVKVNKYRSRQEVSSFPSAYNWLSEDYHKIAIAAFDLYYNQAVERGKLAWMLFMWNEFSSIYSPKTCKTKGWLAALEHTYLECIENKTTYARTAKKFGIATSLVSKNAQLISRHFSRYLLDFTARVAVYPRWDNLGIQERVQCYQEVKQRMQLYTYVTRQAWGKTEAKAHEQFYEYVNTGREFWNGATAETFSGFFKDFYLLDCRNDQYSTQANLFWDDQASRFPPHQKTAAFNIMMSYVSAYRVFPQGGNKLVFEDVFSGKSYDVYGNFGGNIQEKVVPGMISIARLLPLGERMWITEPMFVILPDLYELFDRNLQILLEKLHPYDITDFTYLKIRGEFILKAYILTMDELEQNILNLINQPLKIKWLRASISNSCAAISLLKQSQKFQLLYTDQESANFIWMSYNSSQNYQWGYVAVKKDSVIVFSPPGKDREKFIKDIRRAFKCEDTVIAFRDYEDRLRVLGELQQRMIADLAGFFNNNPELSLALLRQDVLGDEETEWQQGVFLLKLGSLLMEHLQAAKDDCLLEKGP